MAIILVIPQIRCLCRIIKQTIALTNLTTEIRYWIKPSELSNYLNIISNTFPIKIGKTVFSAIYLLNYAALRLYQRTKN